MKKAASLSTKTAFVLLAAWVLNAVPVLAGDPGDLDTTLGGVGFVTTAIGGGDDGGSPGVAIQSDGKIVVAGTSFNGSDNDFALIRYNADGSLDPTFGGDGKVVTPIGTGDEHCQGVVVQPDGKIVAAGSTTGVSGWEPVLVRYNTNGSLDTSFGFGGIQITVISGNDQGVGIALQPDNKIVVTGLAGDSPNPRNVFVMRYNSDGFLDNSFDGDGIVTTDFGGDDSGIGIDLLSDGRIVVVGGRDIGGDNDIVVALYNGDGSLDPTFDGDGMLTLDISPIDYGNAVAVQPDDKILVSGQADDDVALVRYNTDGSRDSTFDSDGIVLTDFGGDTEYGASVHFIHDGKILVGGASYNGSDWDFALVRYNPDGSLDAGFGVGGKVTTAIGTGHDEGIDAGIQANGMIVLAGRSHNGNDYDFAVARYDAGPNPQINAIDDVPGDQGGQVRIFWKRSDHDFAGNQYPVTGYGIWRRVDEMSPAALSGQDVERVSVFSEMIVQGISTDIGKRYKVNESEIWDFVANVNALQFEHYACVVPTLGDSSATGTNWSTFFVSAHTTDPDLFFVSDPQSGYSVDNLAPAVPQGLSAQAGMAEITLEWHSVLDPDFAFFTVYRDTSAGFGSPVAYGYTVDTTFTDSVVQGGVTYHYGVAANDFAGNESDLSELANAVVTGIEQGVNHVPKDFALHQNYPNPFNPKTIIKYSLPKTAKVSLKVYNVLGEEIATLVDSEQAIGFHQIGWDGRNSSGQQVSSGIYIYRIEAENFTSTKKMVFVK